MEGYEHSITPISEYMERHELSQKSFAKRMGVSQSIVSQWLRNEKGMSLTTAERMEKRTHGEIRVRELFPKLFARS